MVDGILANPRNPVIHDLWLTGRFSTSRQPSLFLSLRNGSPENSTKFIQKLQQPPRTRSPDRSAVLVPLKQLRRLPAK